MTMTDWWAGPVAGVTNDGVAKFTDAPTAANIVTIVFIFNE